MGDDCADETNVGVRASLMKAQLKESMRISIAIVTASNDTYADSGIDGESPEIYEMDPRVLLLSIILLGSLLYHLRLLHPFFLSLYDIVFALYS